MIQHLLFQINNTTDWKLVAHSAKSLNIISNIRSTYDDVIISKRVVSVLDEDIYIKNSTPIEKLYYALNDLSVTLDIDTIKVDYLGESLENVLMKYDYDTRKIIATNMLNEVQRLHDHGFVHNDICLRNFVIDDRLNTRLIDFEYSTYNNQSTYEVIESLKIGVTSHAFKNTIDNRNTKLGDVVFLVTSIMELFINDYSIIIEQVDEIHNIANTNTTSYVDLLDHILNLSSTLQHDKQVINNPNYITATDIINDTDYESNEQSNEYST